jgi:hypothetical protein
VEKVRGSLRDCRRSCSGEGAWEFERFSLQCLEKVRGSLRDCCRSCSGEGAWEFERLLSFL